MRGESVPVWERDQNDRLVFQQVYITVTPVTQVTIPPAMTGWLPLLLISLSTGTGNNVISQDFICSFNPQKFRTRSRYFLNTACKSFSSKSGGTFGGASVQHDIFWFSNESIHKACDGLSEEENTQRAVKVIWSSTVQPDKDWHGAQT